MSKARARQKSGRKKKVERQPSGGGHGRSVERQALQVIFDAYLAKHIANRAIIRPAANLAKAGDLRSRKEKSTKRESR